MYGKLPGRCFRLKGLLCLSAAVFAWTTVSAEAADTSGKGPIGGIFGSYPVHDPMDDEYLTGGWNGWRSRLADDGYTLNIDYGSESVGVVRGGLKTGVRYSQQIRAKFAFDMSKIAGWTDSRFHITFNDRRGDSATNELVGEQFGLQENFGGEYTKLSEVSFDQKLLNGRLQYHIGYFSLGNDFGGVKMGTNFISAAFCAHPLVLPKDMGWSDYPNARWGFDVTWYLDKDIYIRTGVSQSNAQLSRERTSFNIFGGKTQGEVFPTEFVYTPGKGTAYPGTYKFGFVYDNTKAQVLGKDRYTHHRDSFYVEAEQKVYSPDNDTRGLGLFAEYAWSDPDTAKLRNWFGGGLIYTGLIPSRPLDKFAFGYIQSSVNKHLLANANAEGQAAADDTGGVFHNYSHSEGIIEADYTFQVTKWASLRPAMQYVVNPGSFNFQHTRNALTVGMGFYLKL